jgi:hypothetical protein
MRQHAACARQGATPQLQVVWAIRVWQGQTGSVLLGLMGRKPCHVDCLNRKPAASIRGVEPYFRKICQQSQCG